MNTPRDMDVWLDCDGVLADFRSGAFALHGKPDSQPRRYDIWNTMGLTQAEFWAPIEAAGAEFWAGLSPYPWLDKLCELVGRFGRVRILTKPAPVAGCLAGKLEWLERHFGAPFSDYHMTPNKHEVAARYRVLIDDNNAELGAWLARGGHPVTFPQPWNVAHGSVGDRLAYVRNQLRLALEMFLKPPSLPISVP